MPVAITHFFCLGWHPQHTTPFVRSANSVGHMSLFCVPAHFLHRMFLSAFHFRHLPSRWDFTVSFITQGSTQQQTLNTNPNPEIKGQSQAMCFLLSLCSYLSHSDVTRSFIFICIFISLKFPCVFLMIRKDQIYCIPPGFLFDPIPLSEDFRAAGCQEDLITGC